VWHSFEPVNLETAEGDGLSVALFFSEAFMADFSETSASSPPDATLPDRRLVFTVGVSIGLLVVLFVALFVPVVKAWNIDPNYSHGYLIPIVCIYLGMRAFHRAGPPSAGDARMAMMSLIPGAVLVLAATVVPWPLITFAALAMILRGLAVAVGGRVWAGYFTAPILFSFFMFPVPALWTSTLALWLQDFVSRMSGQLLEPFLIVIRKGTVLHLVGVPQPLQVGEQCSGLRQLIGFFAFAVLLGLMLDRPAWWRILLVLLAVPFAVLANVLRVLLMCFGATQFGTEWMSGWMHHAPAAFTLPAGFGMILLVDYVLSRLVRAPGPEPAAATAPAAAVRRFDVRALKKCIAALGITLIVQLILLLHLRSVGVESFPQINEPLAGIPTILSENWVGRDVPGVESLRAQLPYTADDILLREYRFRGSGSPVQLYAVHSQVGDDRKHHPEICIREVTGAPEDLEARERVAVSADGSRRVQRFAFRTGLAGRTTVYYWHYTFLPEQSDRTLLQSIHQGLGQHAPSLTVQVSTFSTDPTELAAIENDFLPAVDSIMRERLLPSSAVIATTRLPVTLLRQ